MSNKQQINRLRDNTELAWASYGYFDLVGKKFGNKDEYKGRKDTVITLHDILDSVYNGYIAMGKNRWGQDIELGTLKGDFTPTQAKNFFERYDLLEHQPNINSGFSATLFKDTKADSKDSEYILSIRGTEFKLEQIQDLLNDYYIGTNNDRKAA
ncbi:conserved hypothetical protein [Helicobacter cinaedi PAGU611]|uniref:hypothetical protein n=1 Tax=Helicobacter cinaedi TaxID=213 RepID=UPI00025D36A0|nr:hypothetical protein [Helicobacter cinaedi]BAM12622.1 conserved hypothetical protein [Helicobacter cinaedi PAGU611]BBB20329.1 hypothetical protein HC081234_15060 [Helicobacter cinaedi]